MLGVEVLFTELQRFGDPPALVFTGSPTHRTEARRRWAHAFGVYVAGIIDVADAGGVLTALVPHSGAVPGTLGAGFAADIEQSFFVELSLANTLSVRVAAEDFADAWRTGMRAVQPGVGAHLPAAAPLFTWQGWAPGVLPPRTVVDDRRDVLADQLELLFRVRSIHARVQLHEIAERLHTATYGLTATSTAGMITYH